MDKNLLQKAKAPMIALIHPTSRRKVVNTCKPSIYKQNKALKGRPDVKHGCNPCAETPTQHGCNPCAQTPTQHRGKPRLLLLLLAFLAPLAARAQFGGGDGTANNPYLISTTEHMSKLANNVYNGNAYAHIWFRLENDLDYTGKTYTPIGTVSLPFRGYFNGNGKSINNVTLVTNNFEVGLFRNLDNSAEVYDLKLGGHSRIEGLGLVGGIVGCMDDNSKIIDCEVGADVVVAARGNATAGIGGIVGNAWSGCVISGCVSRATVTDNGVSSCNGIGGIVGLTMYNPSISNCVSLSTIVGTNGVGGIVGEVDSSGTPDITNCLYTNFSGGGIQGMDTDGAAHMSRISFGDGFSEAFVESGLGFDDNGTYYAKDGRTVLLHLMGDSPGWTYNFFGNGAPLSSDGNDCYSATMPILADLLVTATRDKRIISYEPWVSISIPPQEYTGSPLTPVVTVTDNMSGTPVTLVENTHYTVTLPDGGCVFPTNHTITITGIGDFVGQTNAEFAILTPGSGTEDDPYLIFITDQMDELAASVNGGDYKTGLYFRLEADLDYSGKTYTPVGTIAKRFNGNFNGNGHSITNVTLNAGNETDIGVFGMVDTDGTVQNLTLDQSSIVGGDFVGGIAGGCYGSVLNCTVGTNVSLTGNDYVGGIVGDCHGSVLNCTVGTDVSLTGNDYVGGIAGRCEGSVLNCTVGTNISLTGSNDVGGIVGWFAGGTISDCVNAAPVIGAGEVGGIIGTSSFRVPSVQGQITSCRNSGRIESTDFFCGGIGGKFAGKGYLGHPNFTVTGCANTGEVIGYKTVGGIVGMSSYTIVSDCMNQGRITAPAQISNYEQKIGGVIGRLDPGCTISNNYYTGDYYYYEDELGNEQTGQLGGINFQDVTNQAMRGYTIEAYAPLAISLEGSIGVAYEGNFYAGNGQGVVVGFGIQNSSLTPQCYTLSAGTLSDNDDGTYTITMPAEDITIAGNIVESYGTYYEIPCEGGTTATVIYDASYATLDHVGIEDFEYLGTEYAVTAIADGAFDGLGNLEGIDCHSNISSIGTNAFHNCTGITYFGFYHTDTPPTVGEGAFEGLRIDTLWLMVPFCSQYDYSQHETWGQFGEIQGNGNCEYNFTNEAGDKQWSNPANWRDAQMETCTEAPGVGAQVAIFSDCEIDADMTVGSVTINHYYDEYYDLYERLTVKSGNTLTANNFIYTMGDERNFIIEDGAQVIHPNAGAKATVEKNITAYNTTGGTNNGWHLIGSPATESFAPSVNNGFLANEYDLYFYDEPTHYWRNYKPNGQYAGFDIEPLKGYLYANSANDTLGLTGTLRAATETVTKPLSYTDGIELAGFNLVGNPFAHNVTDFTGSNVADEVYRMNGTKDNLMVSVIDDNNPLLPGEGFFVKAIGDNASITFNSRATNAECSNITLEVSENGLLVDRFILKRDGAPLEKFTLNENSTKIYATEDGQDWAVAVIASEAKQSSPTEQALNFKAAKNGTYTLNVNIENMDLDYLHLIDNMTGADVDMLASPTYTFTANTADYASRFRLVFSAQDDAEGDDAPFAYINNGNIVITTDADDATLQVIDMMGRVIVSHDGHTRYIPTTGMPAGVYVLRLIDGDSVRTQKMVID